MGLFKSKDERRVEREMKIRSGMRAIEKSIRQQEKFSEDFIKNAQHARKIGDEQQYQFIRGALKKTATVKKMLERQLLAMKNAMLIRAQAQANAEFAQSMTLMAQQIAQVFGELDLTKTQAQWERAVSQSSSMEERMEVFLDSMEQSAIGRLVGIPLKRRPGQRRRDRPHDPGRRPGPGKAGTRQAGRARKRNRPGVGDDEAEGLSWGKMTR